MSDADDTHATVAGEVTAGALTDTPRAAPATSVVSHPARSEWRERIVAAQRTMTPDERKRVREYRVVRETVIPGIEFPVLMYRDCIYIPRTSADVTALTHDLLRLAHDDAGHCGLRRTEHRLDQLQVYWPGRRYDSDKYIRTCTTCGRNADAIPSRVGTLGSLKAWEPFTVIVIDVMGPLETAADGSKYILTMTDVFTRFLELVPLKAASADTIIKALDDRIVYRYGPPLLVQVDGGANLTSKRVESYISAHGGEMRLGVPYHPQSQGLAERQHRDIGRMLRALCARSPTTWAASVMRVQFELNNAFNRSIQMSAHEALYGCTAVRPLIDTGAVSHADMTLDQRQHLIARIHQSVEATLARTREQMQREYTRKRKPVHYNVGDCVYLLNPARHRPKLSTAWNGPYFIVRKESDNVYIIKDRISEKPRKVHVEHLKPFDTTRANLEQEENNLVATDHYVIDSIIEHQLSAQRGHKAVAPLFLVKWRGLEDSENSWERYDALSHTPQLRRYLTDHPELESVVNEYKVSLHH